MEFDFQWLLIGLPIAFALGWIASRIDLRQWRRDQREIGRRIAQVRADGHIDLGVARTALDMLEVDRFGLDEIDQKIMLSTPKMCSSSGAST